MVALQGRVNASRQDLSLYESYYTLRGTENISLCGGGGRASLSTKPAGVNPAWPAGHMLEGAKVASLEDRAGAGVVEG